MIRMNRLIPWVVGGIVLSFAVGSLYLVAQQLDRGGADDQPERLATQLASVTTIPSPDPSELVDLAASEAVFYVVYDTQGTALSGTGELHGALAEVPTGVITAAVENGRNAVTWQPEHGLRFATVSVSGGDRVILAGQSLAPSEARTDQLGALLLLAWAIGMLVLGAGAVLASRAGS